MTENVTVEEREYYSLVREAFETIAPFYDVVALPLTRVRDKVVSFTGARSGSQILDVGTGTATQAFAFAKKGYDVIGVDLSEAMLQVARRKNTYEHVRFEVGDATRLRFADNTFEVSYVSYTLHDMPLTIRGKALREMVRVTKPGGIIVIVDYALPKSKVGRFLVYHLVNLYEGKYYSTFIESDFEALLETTGIELQAELSVLLGAGRILKGIKRITPWTSK